MTHFDEFMAVTNLLGRAANLLDAVRLEEWVECFTDDGRYYILSRENYERKLPLRLFQCRVGFGQIDTRQQLSLPHAIADACR